MLEPTRRSIAANIKLDYARSEITYWTLVGHTLVTIENLISEGENPYSYINSVLEEFDLSLPTPVITSGDIEINDYTGINELCNKILVNLIAPRIGELSRLNQCVRQGRSHKNKDVCNAITCNKDDGIENWHIVYDLEQQFFASFQTFKSFKKYDSGNVAERGRICTIEDKGIIEKNGDFRRYVFRDPSIRSYDTKCVPMPKAKKKKRKDDYFSNYRDHS